MEDVRRIWDFVDESPDGLFPPPRRQDETYPIHLILRAGKLVRASSVMSEAVEYILVDHPLSFLLCPVVMMLVDALRVETQRVLHE